MISQVAEESRGSREPRGSKLKKIYKVYHPNLSRLARASWIEIFPGTFHSAEGLVEARESLVDRNRYEVFSTHSLRCRGSREPRGSKYPSRVGFQLIRWSRLARASWIEIMPLVASAASMSVEARESLVDRNSSATPRGNEPLPSRLARASWIEMYLTSSPWYSPGSRGSREPRGSKSALRWFYRQTHLSRLARASWIEMLVS